MSKAKITKKSKVKATKTNFMESGKLVQAHIKAHQSLIKEQDAPVLSVKKSVSILEDEVRGLQYELSLIKHQLDQNIQFLSKAVNKLDDDVSSQAKAVEVDLNDLESRLDNYVELHNNLGNKVYKMASQATGANEYFSEALGQIRDEISNVEAIAILTGGLGVAAFIGVVILLIFG